MAVLPQSWNWLENKEDEDNKMSRRVWKTVETKVEEVRVIEEKRRRKEIEGKGVEKREKEEEKNSEVRERGQKIGFSKVS